MNKKLIASLYRYSRSLKIIQIISIFKEVVKGNNSNGKDLVPILTLICTSPTKVKIKEFDSVDKETLQNNQGLITCVYIKKRKKDAAVPCNISKSKKKYKSLFSDSYNDHIIITQDNKPPSWRGTRSAKVKH